MSGALVLATFGFKLQILVRAASRMLHGYEIEVYRLKGRKERKECRKGKSLNHKSLKLQVAKSKSVNR